MFVRNLIKPSINKGFVKPPSIPFAVPRLFVQTLVSVQVAVFISRGAICLSNQMTFRQTAISRLMCKADDGKCLEV